MSRVMLALKAIFARIDRNSRTRLREVDTGVSGRAAQAVAEKLSLLSRQCQVFAITHLPQVACMADHQYEIRQIGHGKHGRETSVRELAARRSGGGTGQNARRGGSNGKNSPSRTRNAYSGRAPKKRVMARNSIESRKLFGNIKASGPRLPYRYVIGSIPLAGRDCKGA